MPPYSLNSVPEDARADESGSQVTRRQFLQTTGAAAAAIALPTIIPSSARGKDGATPPSERINLGVIGVNGMGRANVNNCARYPDVVVTAVCDVSKQRRDAVLEQFKQTATSHNDYRELLARPDVDAVIIATPPHWHALMAIEAAEAGKDIYLQKPMTLYPDETLAVRNAVRRHGRVSQVGTQIHAGPNYRRVVEWIQSGRLGPVGVVRTFNVMNQGSASLKGSVPSIETFLRDFCAPLRPLMGRPFRAQGFVLDVYLGLHPRLSCGGLSAF